MRKEKSNDPLEMIGKNSATSFHKSLQEQGASTSLYTGYSTHSELKKRAVEECNGNTRAVGGGSATLLNCYRGSSTGHSSTALSKLLCACNGGTQKKQQSR